jgi:hypothetical protein
MGPLAGADRIGWRSTKMTRLLRRRRLSVLEGLALLCWIVASFWSLGIVIGAASRAAALSAGRLLIGTPG